MMYYVYVHRRKSDRLPFYVGKGSGERAWFTANRRNYWKNVAAKHGVTVEVVRYFKNESEAYRYEEFLIDFMLGRGMPIVNFRRGGNRASGWHHTEETKMKLSASLRARSKGVHIVSSLGEVFSSMGDAVEYLRASGYPNANHAGIIQTVDKPNRTAYGRSWSNVIKPDHPELTGANKLGKHRKKPVLRSDGRIFDSAKDAAEVMSVEDGMKRIPQCISNACSGRQSSAYGYSWQKLA